MRSDLVDEAMSNDLVLARDRTITLADARTLGYTEFGTPSGRPLLYFHGHPGSRLEARFLAAPAAHAQEIVTRVLPELGREPTP